jgi:hypothetical protein
MTFLKLLALTGFAASLAIGTAQATIVTGTGTFADTGAVNNNLNFTGTVNNADITGLDLALNTPYTFNDFLDIAATDTAGSFFGTTKTDTIATNFIFTSPGDASGSVTGSGSDTAYKFLGHITGSDGTITWDNPSAINFADGAILNITLGSADFAAFSDKVQNVKISATFDLIQAPIAVPEPGSFMVFGTALIGLGLVLRRRTKA